MSFGDPNNPYGAPQGQQPGYGYPQAPPMPQGGYGEQPFLTTMPSTVSTARVLLWVIVGLQIIGVALYSFAAVATKKDDSAFTRFGSASSGLLWAIVVFAAAWAVFAIVLAVKFSTGGNGLRVTTLVFGIITAILGIFPFVIIGLLHTVLAILIAVFVGNSNGAAWFNRPRQPAY
ncbi:hypothetical protein ABZ845_23060 [Streptomyces sp. NPDC047022]|uniref:hypothetical protein n=1 Tax=Streptomyces sp. NPDC047022 TaxID=3155737 RepID=UPI0033DB20D7